MKKYSILSVLLLLALIVSCCGCAGQEQPAVEPLTVTLLKVGKADAIVALSGPQALVLDTGEEEDGEEVAAFLQHHGVSQVEAMIITHYDRDHVGGADTVLESLPVKTVYVPDYEGTSTEYQDFLAAAEAAAVPIERLREPVQFAFGDAEVLIEPPDSYEIPANGEEYDNNFSLITTIVHGDNRLVFLADAEKQRIRQWLQTGSAEQADFLKVPHHGIYNGALDELLSTVRPKVSVICSSQKHPAEARTLELLLQSGSEVYETKDGNVQVISDGTHLEVQQKRK